ncbi:DUF448 domain-containing protein [Humidisolicoccus flavus]|uniref:DUF448 domain-containing protein n=1 Tax=Humidisolicoccus flavus TaxID=3111414 RepID=UPI003D2FA468
MRIVANDGAAVVDHSQHAVGRGSWVHPQTQCVERGIRAVPRALRAGTLDLSPVSEWAATLVSVPDEDPNVKD